MPASIADLKNDLHRMVVDTDDPEILEQIAFLFAAMRGDKSLWDTLSEAEQQEIQKGLDDLRAGRTKSNEEVRAKVRALLH
ncbi:MAG: hypothetical protein H6574_15420 [Lewinellaceae bacterium]|nr:hypothetical protein [Saprospiraceae bacterium]MCB9315795.1 hypothetical protein [Lewinellaceae bacterium]MCB9332470.1 hypothetical protein [Lewinellaceae bacterium]